MPPRCGAGLVGAASRPYFGCDGTQRCGAVPKAPRDGTRCPLRPKTGEMEPPHGSRQAGKAPPGSHPVPKGHTAGGGGSEALTYHLCPPPPLHARPRGRAVHPGEGAALRVTDSCSPRRWMGLKPGAQRSAARGHRCAPPPGPPPTRCAPSVPPGDPPADPVGDTGTQTGPHLGTIGRCSAPGWRASVGVGGSAKRGQKSATPRTPSRPAAPGTAASPARFLVPKRGGGGSVGTPPLPAAGGRRWLLHQRLLNDKREPITPPCREERGDGAAVTAPGLCPSAGTAAVTAPLAKVTRSIPARTSGCAPLGVPWGVWGPLWRLWRPFWGDLMAPLRGSVAILGGLVPLLEGLVALLGVFGGPLEGFGGPFGGFGGHFGGLVSPFGGFSGSFGGIWCPFEGFGGPFWGLSGLFDGFGGHSGGFGGPFGGIWWPLWEFGGPFGGLVPLWGLWWPLLGVQWPL